MLADRGLVQDGSQHVYPLFSICFEIAATDVGSLSAIENAHAHRFSPDTAAAFFGVVATSPSINAKDPEQKFEVLTCSKADPHELLDATNKQTGSHLTAMCNTKNRTPTRRAQESVMLLPRAQQKAV